MENMKRPWTPGEKWLFAGPLLLGVVVTAIAMGPNVLHDLGGYPTELPATTGTEIVTMALSSNGRLLVAGESIHKPAKATTNSIRLWDARSLEPLSPLNRPVTTKRIPELKRMAFDRATYNVAVSPDAKTLAWSSTHRGPIFTDLGNRQELWSLEAESGSPRFSPDGRLVALETSPNSLQIFASSTGKPIVKWHLGFMPMKTAYQFSPQGHFFASSGPLPKFGEWRKAPNQKGGGVEVRRVSDWKIERVLPLPNPSHIAFSPDERSLVGVGRIFPVPTQGTDGQFCVSSYDVLTGRVKWEIGPGQPEAHPGISVILEVCYSPDGVVVAVAGVGSVVLLLSAETGQVVRSLPFQVNRGAVSPVLADLAFSPDGKRLFAYNSRAVLVWDLD
jgi:WD40 repeat protein